MKIKNKNKKFNFSIEFFIKKFQNFLKVYWNSLKFFGVPGILQVFNDNFLLQLPK